MAEQIPEDQRIAAALSYLFTPMVPVVVLLNPVWRQIPYLRRHAIQALLWALVFLFLLLVAVVAIVALVRQDILFICLSPFIVLLAFVPGIAWARRIFYGGDVTIPVLGRFVPLDVV